MSGTSKIIIWIIIIIVVAVGVWYGVGKKPAVTPETKEPIKIGALFPLTGDLASYALEAQRALEMGVEEINAAGGIQGRNIKVVYEDGKCDPKEAVTGAQKLVNIDKVKIIIGEACSGATLAAAPITEATKVILLSPWSTSPKVTTAGDYVFRVTSSDTLAGKKTAELAYNTFGHKKGTVIAENTDFAQALKDSFTENFEKLGGKVVVSENYTTADTDMRTQILKVKNSEAEFVFFVPQTPTPGALLTKQAKESGLTIRFIGNEFFGDQHLLEVAGEAVENLVYYVPAGPRDDPKTQKFYDDFKNKYGIEIAITQYTPNVYDAIQLIAEGLRRYGEDTEKIRDYFYSIKDYQGVSGRFSFDENGDVDKDYTLMIVKDGKPEEYEK